MGGGGGGSKGGKLKKGGRQACWGRVTNDKNVEHWGGGGTQRQERDEIRGLPKKKKARLKT